jgi:hypothetical protein
MSNELTGKIKVLNEVKNISDTFKVREFVVTIDADGQYPQHITIQATNDKCDALSTFAIGSDVTVHYNLRGREGKPDAEGNVRYWNSLDMWRIEAATAAAPAANAEAPVNQTPVTAPEAQGGDDLPF